MIFRNFDKFLGIHRVRNTNPINIAGSIWKTGYNRIIIKRRIPHLKSFFLILLNISSSTSGKNIFERALGVKFKYQPKRNEQLMITANTGAMRFEVIYLVRIYMNNTQSNPKIHGTILCRKIRSSPVNRIISDIYIWVIGYIIEDGT